MAKINRIHRGFTLIELLVVVAIIALLISILLPSLHRARQQAKEVVCAARLHDVGVSLLSYTSDFKAASPQNTIGANVRSPLSQRTAVGMWGYKVHEELASHMGGMRKSVDTDELSKAHEVFYCPLLPEKDMDFVDVLSGPGTGRGIDNADDQYIHISYSYFGRLDEVENDPAKPRPWEPDPDEIPLKRGRYARPLSNSDDVLMADTFMMWGGGGKWRINHGPGWQEPINFSPFSIPKFDSVNELFADGHAVKKTPQHFAEFTDARNVVTLRRNATLIANVDSLWW